MTIKPPKIASTVRAATLFDARPIVGDTGCDGCVRQFRFSVMPSQSEAGIESLGRSITARSAGQSNAKIPLQDLLERASVIRGDIREACLNDVHQFKDGFIRAYRHSRIDPFAFAVTLGMISGRHPDKAVRDKAQVSYESLQTLVAETMSAALFGMGSPISDMNEDELWENLHASLKFVDGQRNHDDISTAIALLYKIARETNAPEICDRLEFHTNPIVRGLYLTLLVDVYCIDIDIGSLWKTHQPLIQRDMALLNEDSDIATDAAVLLGRFAEWGNQEAKLTLILMAINHEDGEMRRLASFLLQGEGCEFDDSGI